ncbi:cystatin-B-like, partial [Huso huso]
RCRIVGGFSEIKPATKEEQKICNAASNKKAEKLVGKNFDVFTAKKSRTQVVAGANYLIKVHVEGEEYVHPLFSSLPCERKPLDLTGIQTSKHRDDDLVPF